MKILKALKNIKSVKEIADLINESSSTYGTPEKIAGEFLYWYSESNSTPWSMGEIYRIFDSLKKYGAKFNEESARSVFRDMKIESMENHNRSLKK